MKRHSIFPVILLITFSASLCLAQMDKQPVKGDFKPAVTNQPGSNHGS